jgi:hypothetical protein
MDRREWVLPPRELPRKRSLCRSIFVAGIVETFVFAHILLLGKKRRKPAIS